MTKEEIMADEYSKLIQNWEKAYKQHPSIFKAAHSAMDEYAKQQCIAYAHWLFKRILPHMTPQEAPAAEAENLYNKFLTETSI